MTRYTKFKELKKLLELEQTSEHCYNKLVISGDLRKDHFDYNEGVYDVSIYYQMYASRHFCRVWFGTIDDGDFGSWNECSTKEEALDLLHKIVEKFKEITVCPSLEKLNESFQKLGVYFCRE